MEISEAVSIIILVLWTGLVIWVLALADKPPGQIGAEIFAKWRSKSDEDH